MYSYTCVPYKGDRRRVSLVLAAFLRNTPSPEQEGFEKFCMCVRRLLILQFFSSKSIIVEPIRIPYIGVLLFCFVFVYLFLFVVSFAAQKAGTCAMTFLCCKKKHTHKKVQKRYIIRYCEWLTSCVFWHCFHFFVLQSTTSNKKGRTEPNAGCKSLLRRVPDREQLRLQQLACDPPRHLRYLKRAGKVQVIQTEPPNIHIYAQTADGSVCLAFGRSSGVAAYK